MLGQNNDQLGTFFLVIFAATVVGAAASAITIDVNQLTHPIMLAIGLLAIAAFVHSHATSLTRASQLYVTQALNRR